MRKITTRVPATVANLGSGFDCLGLAVGLYLDVTLEVDGDREGMEISGEGADRLPNGRSNLVRRAIARYADTLGQPLPPFWLSMRNRIPTSGGLGGSASAIVAGLLLANELLGRRLAAPELLELATEIEGHPDNVAPALQGGLILATRDEGRVISLKVPVPPALHSVVFVPDFAMPTAEARRILPRLVSRGQAIFNLGRAATLVAAMYSGRVDLLRVATQDQLHQPYRQQMFPAMPTLLRRRAGGRRAGRLSLRRRLGADGAGRWAGGRGLGRLSAGKHCQRRARTRRGAADLPGRRRNLARGSARTR